jgi:hypothetical protein
MGFSWSSLSIGDKITYTDGVGIDELRDNSDTLHAALTNVTYNGTVQGTQNSSVNSSNYSNYPSNYPSNNSLQGYK